MAEFPGGCQQLCFDSCALLRVARHVGMKGQHPVCHLALMGLGPWCKSEVFVGVSSTLGPVFCPKCL